jgi:hypothetical protein
MLFFSAYFSLNNDNCSFYHVHYFLRQTICLFDIPYVEKNALRGGAEQDRPVVRVETQQAQRCP